MKERRAARVGTVSGLALLAGATAVAAVAGGRHSAFTTGTLGLLACALGHSLLDEIRRQATRRMSGWVGEDTVNTALLTSWATIALIMTVAVALPVRVRTVAAALFLGYAATVVLFVRLRRRTVVAVASAASLPASTTTDVADQLPAVPDRAPTEH